MMVKGSFPELLKKSSKVWRLTRASQGASDGRCRAVFDGECCVGRGYASSQGGFAAYFVNLNSDVLNAIYFLYIFV